jgi:hypothetical protein
MEANEGKRKRLAREIETKLADDDARPIIFYTASPIAGSLT